MSEIDDLIGHLGAALVQSVPSDDQIIMGHVRDAHELAKQIRKQKSAETDAANEKSIAELIALFYRREIGVLMQQAEHWANENFPLAVHHRVMKSDSYYQIVALCERFASWNENPFGVMRREVVREPIKPLGTYPPGERLNAYRHPTYVVEQLKTASREAGGSTS